jgi:hypothetical protein
MSLSAIRTAIKTKVAAVTNVLKVYDYQRQWTTVAEFDAGAVTATVIQWWTVSLLEYSLHELSNCEAMPYYKFKIMGYYGAEDSAASEKTFHGLVEDVCNAFGVDMDLGGTVEPGDIAGHPFVNLGLPKAELGEGQEIRTKFLLHTARIELAVRDVTVVTIAR